MRDYSGGYARTTVEQNLLLRWVRDESLYEVWRALDELGLGHAGASTIVDTVSCPAPTRASSASRARWASTAR